MELRRCLTIKPEYYRHHIRQLTIDSSSELVTSTAQGLLTIDLVIIEYLASCVGELEPQAGVLIHVLVPTDTSTAAAFGDHVPEVGDNHAAGLAC